MTTQLGHLVHSLERRTDHLRAINEAGRQISSILDLDELLPYVARSLLQTFEYQTVRILLLGRDEAVVLLTYDDSGEGAGPTRTPFDDDVALHYPAIAQVAREGQPILLPATRSAAMPSATVGPPGAMAEDSRDTLSAGNAAPTYSEIAVAIRIGEDLVGVLDITAHEDAALDEQDLFAAQTLADQLAIAIENSRLYEHAHELAAGRERQRLARDLHDAVSQTLFSVSLIAEVLPRIYARDPEQGAARLEELRQLTRGALAEMRTLLLELRPAALAEAKLPDLLKQLGEAVTGRARIPVEVDTEGAPELPTEVRLAFYRIAQEALNNVAKHSSAGKAKLSLAPIPESPEGARLTIEDDGAGFDPAGAGGGQLGMGIMKERAEAVGAHVVICSAPGDGTTVAVTWGSGGGPPD
jgi:signal transduction histidine kinase